LLDINLPRRNGLEVLGAMREADNVVPVIVLSARDGEYDKVAALRLGADDYVTKPFALAELLARIDAVLRRSQPATAPRARAHDHRRRRPLRRRRGRQRPAPGDPGRRAGQADSPRVRALWFLVRHPSQVFGRHRLLAQVWGRPRARRAPSTTSWDSCARLEVDPERPKHFITVRGSGYRFDP
jgi:DNA-binding response OmpR family regulator